MPDEPTDTELQTRRDAGAPRRDVLIGRSVPPAPAPPPAYRDPYAAPGLRGSVAGFYILLAVLGLALIGAGGVYLTRQHALQQNAEVGVAAPEQAPSAPDANAGPSGSTPPPEAASSPAPSERTAPATPVTTAPAPPKSATVEYPVPPAPTLTPITPSDAPPEPPAPPAPAPDTPASAPSAPAPSAPAPPSGGSPNTLNGVTVTGATPNPGGASPSNSGAPAAPASGPVGGTPGEGGRAGSSTAGGGATTAPGTAP